MSVVIAHIWAFNRSKRWSVSPVRMPPLPFDRISEVFRGGLGVQGIALENGNGVGGPPADTLSVSLGRFDRVSSVERLREPTKCQQQTHWQEGRHTLMKQPRFFGVKIPSHHQFVVPSCVML